MRNKVQGRQGLGCTGRRNRKRDINMAKEKIHFRRINVLNESIKGWNNFYGSRLKMNSPLIVTAINSLRSCWAVYCTAALSLW